jgi:hypothetical protein
MASLDRLSATYQDALQNRLGIEVHRSSKDTLTFTQGALDMTVDLFPNDPEFLRLFVREQLPPELDLETCHQMCSRVTRQIKVAKITIEDAHVLGAVEMFVAGTSQLPQVEQLTAVLPRAIRVLEAAMTRCSEIISLEVALLRDT